MTNLHFRKMFTTDLESTLGRNRCSRNTNEQMNDRLSLVEDEEVNDLECMQRLQF
jgi:hypothetical protein